VVTKDEVVMAAFAIPKSTKIDSVGLCTLALCFHILIRPEWWTAWFNLLLNTPEMLEDVTILGPVKEKLRGVISSNQSRALLQQPVGNCLRAKLWEPLRGRLCDDGLDSLILSGMP
jgi:hypothetical protein